MDTDTFQAPMISFILIQICVYILVNIVGQTFTFYGAADV